MLIILQASFEFLLLDCFPPQGKRAQSGVLFKPVAAEWETKCIHKGICDKLNRKNSTGCRTRLTDIFSRLANRYPTGTSKQINTFDKKCCCGANAVKSKIIEVKNHYYLGNFSHNFIYRKFKQAKILQQTEKMIVRIILR